LFISEIRIENFRLFGAGVESFAMHLNPGLTALVGENDVGKTAVIDALRLVLGTRDQEYLRLESTDFHQPPTGGKRADQILIRCTFEGLTSQDRSAFVEHLTYRKKGELTETVLCVTWIAKINEKVQTSRRFLPVEWRSGAEGDGPILEPGARFLLMATYLRPLRDAERAMAAGRGSRLSQILQHTKEIKSKGEPYNQKENPTPDPTKLSVLGLGDYANYLLGDSDGIKSTRAKLNTDYLLPLSFSGDPLAANISVSRSSDEAARLRQLLEKLEVSLGTAGLADESLTRGLGSNNILFMACELLLLASEEEGFPLLLIEEPEVHLHPQRQLRLMGFLQDQAMKSRGDGQQIQIIVTTHSPNLASDIKLDNLVLIRDRRAFSMACGQTKLGPSDYRFLERFLDVTKANLFFARGVVIVEGDAENILLPTLAWLIDRDFRQHGVSVVNVGGVGLRRYANIFLRSDAAKDGEISIPVACITDMDVMPDCAPWIVGKLGEAQAIPETRNWRMKKDFTAETIAIRRENIRSRASGQRVETFVSDEWTLEYDLAFSGLSEEVWVAAHLAERDEDIQNGTTSIDREIASARADFGEKSIGISSREELASHVYAWFAKKKVSKPIAAQYLSDILEGSIQKGDLTAPALLKKLPSYLVKAIEYVTRPFETNDGEDANGRGQSG
jgi:putative ATP-dependent endonuclease of OLD family